jgi:ribonuclease P protein component
MRAAPRVASDSSRKLAPGSFALRLPRTARLLRPADFATLRGAAQRTSSRHFRAEYRVSPSGAARLGMAVSRRVSKLAVVRNRIRRVTREYFRLHRASIANLDVLLVARTSAAEQTNAVLRADLASLWHKLAALKESGATGTMRANS